MLVYGYLLQQWGRQLANVAYNLLGAFRAARLDRVVFAAILVLLPLLLEFPLALGNLADADPIEVLLDLLDYCLLPQRRGQLRAIAKVDIDKEFSVKVRVNPEFPRDQGRHNPLVDLFEVNQGPGNVLAGMGEFVPQKFLGMRKDSNLVDVGDNRDAEGNLEITELKTLGTDFLAQGA